MSSEVRPQGLPVALAALRRGWQVFPLSPNGKLPAIPSAHPKGDAAYGRCHGECGRLGHGFHDATDDASVVRGWWSYCPTANVGIATGGSGLLVVDLDTPKPESPPAPEAWRMPGVTCGADVFAVLCEQAGQPWPDTFAVRTGRGGWHLYFRQPPGTALRCTTGSTAQGLGWLIDTRGHGGYVAAPGSIVAGRPYTVAVGGEVADLPAWLVERLTPAPLPAQRPVAVPLATGRLSGYLRRAVEAERTRVLDSPEGGHNIALYRAAVALGQLVAGGALGEADVTAWLTEAAERVGQLPGETARTIRSGLAAGAKRPRSVAA